MRLQAHKYFAAHVGELWLGEVICDLHSLSQHRYGSK